LDAERPGMSDKTEDIEMRLLLEALFQKYHYRDDLDSIVKI
jgi:hypothetical protein